MLSQKFFYESGNKSGRMLAAALKRRADSSRVDGIGVGQGNTIHIASRFQEYYSALYNLNLAPLQATGRGTLIEDFLDAHCLSPITAELASYLESPLTAEELLVAP